MKEQRLINVPIETKDPIDVKKVEIHERWLRGLTIYQSVLDKYPTTVIEKNIVRVNS